MAAGRAALWDLAPEIAVAAVTFGMTSDSDFGLHSAGGNEALCFALLGAKFGIGRPRFRPPRTSSGHIAFDKISDRQEGEVSSSKRGRLGRTERL